MRLYILLRIDQLKPAAESLKIKTGLVISPSLKPILDGQPPFSGFPAILSNGNCTDCNHISNCFNYDCVLLEKLMRFMNRFMSTEYRTDIGRITIELNVIREQMGCDAVHVTMPEYTCQNKEMDYMIAKDTVQFIGSLSQRYS
ncbi:uncharacterized protein [Mytilus edulis]|uniref:uncharacterized protein n=1 Tax=Mytilus edulis TaxID=6550 RepID=UPI0039EFCE6E